MTVRPRGDRRTTIALAATIGVLAAGNIVRSTLVPPVVHLPVNVALAGAVAAVAIGAGATTNEVGLARRYVRSGVRWGGAAFAAVTVAVVGAALVPAASGFFDDDRAEISFGELLFDVTVRIPIGTVLLEEIAFRGIILALLVRMTSVRWAVVASSLLFGLWHVLPAWTSVAENAGIATFADSSGGGLLVVAGTVAATTVAGVVFCWLRLRSGSLLAPMLAHVATNTVPLVAAWVLAR